MFKFKLLMIIIGILLSGNILLYRKVSKLNKELEIAINNSIAWENIANNSNKNNNTLKLTIEDFKASNDSLIQEINKQRKELKIKDKQLKQTASTNTVIRDTAYITIPTKDTDFTVELKPNDLTTITINRRDSILSHTLEILNRQDLFVYTEKIWRNNYRNWFQRLIHFDFKKDKINKYQIINSNDLIQVLDTRVIEIQ